MLLLSQREKQNKIGCKAIDISVMFNTKSKKKKYVEKDKIQKMYV